mmetsp:Transcript_57564/g.132782  ORF Transcript_57564/g.132782 Transcript_57564/m.132782 type:complete len:213 (+) Transcript_57564:656-1294(+)
MSRQHGNISIGSVLHLQCKGIPRIRQAHNLAFRQVRGSQRSSHPCGLADNHWNSTVCPRKIRVACTTELVDQYGHLPGRGHILSGTAPCNLLRPLVLSVHLRPVLPSAVPRGHRPGKLGARGAPPGERRHQSALQLLVVAQRRCWGAAVAALIGGDARLRLGGQEAVDAGREYGGKWGVVEPPAGKAGNVLLLSQVPRRGPKSCCSGKIHIT